MLFFVCSEAVESKLVKLETSRGKVILPPMTNDECSLNEPLFSCCLNCRGIFSFQISNHTTSTIEVTCHQGFNGGLPQHFLMEVFETINNTQILVSFQMLLFVGTATQLVILPPHIP